MSKGKQQFSYLETSSSFCNIAYIKIPLNSDAIAMRYITSNTSKLAIEVSFAVSLNLSALFGEVIPEYCVSEPKRGASLMEVPLIKDN